MLKAAGTIGDLEAAIERHGGPAPDAQKLVLEATQAPLPEDEELTLVAAVVVDGCVVLLGAQDADEGAARRVAREAARMAAARMAAARDAAEREER